jgi:hypothetical protein
LLAPAADVLLFVLALAQFHERCGAGVFVLSEGNIREK